MVRRRYLGLLFPLIPTLWPYAYKGGVNILEFLARVGVISLFNEFHGDKTPGSKEKRLQLCVLFQLESHKLNVQVFAVTVIVRILLKSFHHPTSVPQKGNL